ncbi:MAG: hypothetical protein KDC98_03320 [Planctomycetes bacterium]|nr:hypothetical protein [Planctomycetota bacterium]
MPAPGGETAVSAPGVGDTQVAGETDNAGTSEGLGAVFAWAPGDLVFARTDSVDHSWIGSRGRRMCVSFQLSYSMPAGFEETANAALASNWDRACERARNICERADLTTEQGQMSCEEELCGELDRVLFAGDGAAPRGHIERVIWKRVTWN